MATVTTDTVVVRVDTTWTCVSVLVVVNVAGSIVVSVVVNSVFVVVDIYS